MDQDSFQPDCLPHFHLTSGRDPARAFDEWREATEPLFDVRIDGADGPAGFDVDLEGYHLGRMVIGTSRSVGQRFRRDRVKIARNPLDHYVVQLYTAGGSCGTAGRHDLDLRPGDISVRDLSQPYATTDPDFANITLVIPRQILAPLLRDPDGLHGLMLSRRQPVANMLGGHLRALVQSAPRMTPADALALDQGTVALVAGCVGAAATAEGVERAMRIAMLDRIRRHIDAELASPALTPDAICRRFGISRSALYRLFQPLGGLAAHVRRRRLDRAFADLTAATGDRPRLSEICDRYGFPSEATFSRAFRNAFGVAPRDIRRLPRQAVFHLMRQDEGTSLQSWLWRLGTAPAD